jgi:hypothetical protein
VSGPFLTKPIYIYNWRKGSPALMVPPPLTMLPPHSKFLFSKI